VAGNIISRFLDTTGDGTGNKDAILDYSAVALGAEQFMIAPAAGETFIISRMIVSYEDVKNWNSDLYGKAIALTNGIKVEVHRDGAFWYGLTDPDFPVKSNGEWASFCYDFALFAFGTGLDWASVRWTFTKSGSDVKLRGDRSERLVVTLNDDFTDLTHHHFLVQGKQVI
jgi:hypothetical protein